MSMAIKINEDLGKRAETFFSELGLDLDTAVNMFLIQSLRQRRIPFIVGYENEWSELGGCKNCRRCVRVG